MRGGNERAECRDRPKIRFRYRKVCRDGLTRRVDLSSDGHMAIESEIMGNPRLIPILAGLAFGRCAIVLGGDFSFGVIMHAAHHGKERRILDSTCCLLLEFFNRPAPGKIRKMTECHGNE